jgi:hypothetical protein
VGFKLVDIIIADKRDHPLKPGRVDARVEAHMVETQPGYTQNHVINVRVHVTRKPGVPEDIVDHELRMKAVNVLERVRASLGDGGRRAAE